jgi:hypothetical protein
LLPMLNVEFTMNILSTRCSITVSNRYVYKSKDSLIYHSGIYIEKREGIRNISIVFWISCTKAMVQTLSYSRF